MITHPRPSVKGQRAIFAKNFRGRRKPDESSPLPRAPPPRLFSRIFRQTTLGALSLAANGLPPARVASALVQGDKIIFARASSSEGAAPYLVPASSPRKLSLPCEGFAPARAIFCPPFFRLSSPPARSFPGSAPLGRFPSRGAPLVPHPTHAAPRSSRAFPP